MLFRSGYLLKHTAPEELVAAVRRAAAGDPVLSPAAARSLIAHAAGGSAGSRSRAARQRLAALSPREREVAVAVARGWSNAEIAGRLYLSVGSVKAHISSALAKLGLDNRVQLALLAHDASTANPLLPTLRAYLACDGNKSQAAEKLFVQRRTLYYRLERLEGLLGKSLEDPETRQGLALAVRALDFLGAQEDHAVRSRPVAG